MAFLEMSVDKSIQVFEEKYLYSKWRFRRNELSALYVKYGLKINQDIFIVERYKNSNGFYPVPLLFIETTNFKRVIEGEMPLLLARYCQTYKVQHRENRLGRLRYECHTAEELETLLGITAAPQPITVQQTDTTKQEENYMI